jgi:hypothetical protein
MAYVKEELVVSPYTGKEEMFYSVYKYDGTGEFDFVASTYSKEEAYGKYYERALRCEKADERRAKEAEERKAREEEEAKRKAEEEANQPVTLDTSAEPGPAEEDVTQTKPSEN